MKWYITTKGYAKVNRKNAGAKAPKDIAEICERFGMYPLKFYPFPCDVRSNLYKKLWLITIGAFPWLKVFWTVHKGDIILYQHPLYGSRLIRRVVPLIKKYRGCKFIALIHDLESLRQGTGVSRSKCREQTNYIADNILLKQFDVVICHNRIMREYLISQGVDPEKVICLEVFDYLASCTSGRGELSQIPSIAVAGNLSPKKSNYIYQMYYSKDQLTVHLYGAGFDKGMAAENMNYHGSFEPEKLPDSLIGDFGLVWDGCSTETCAGNTGEYLRYNNPHKISLYLASNMPVIVWKESALADYVCKNKLGFAVASLDEIAKQIRTLSSRDYKTMCESARHEGEKLRNGYYTKQALQKAIHLIEE